MDYPGMKLTARERAAVRSALAAFIAGDHDEEEFDGFEMEDADSALEKVQEAWMRKLIRHGEGVALNCREGEIETFRPGDRVRLNGLVYPLPAFLASELGTIRTMYYGRGRRFDVWYARVEFDASTKLRTVKLSDLLRVDGDALVRT